MPPDDQQQKDNPAGPQCIKIGGEAIGDKEEVAIEEAVDLALVEEEDRAQVEEKLVVVADEEDELGLAMLATTRWRVIAVGCEAIWPATVPK